MNNVFLLVKLYHLGLFKRNKGGQSRLGGSSLLLPLSLLIYVYLFSFLSFNIANILAPLQNYTPLLALTMAVASAFTFFNIAFKGSNLLFQAEDEEFLLSLPISFKELMAAKIINLYAFNVLLSSLIMAPGAIIYGQRTSAGVLYYLLSVIGFFIAPLLPVAVAVALNVALETFIGDFKGKKFLSLTFSLIFTMSVIFINQKIADMNTEEITSLVAMLNKQINNIYPLAGYYANALAQNNLLSLALFSFISFASLAVLSFLTAKYYHSIRERLSNNITHRIYDGRVAKGNSLMLALLKKEVKLYFSSPVYVLNTVVGPIFMLLGAFAPMFNKGVFSELFQQVPQQSIISFLPVLLAASASLTATTPFSLSLEGHMYNWLKSLPIRPQEVFRAKILLNLGLILPATLVASVIISFALAFSPLYFLMSLVLTLLTSYYVAQSGILINLNFPKFDFINHNAVVKQSMAGIISVTNGFFLGGVLVYAALRVGFAYINIYYLVVIVLLILVNLFVNFVLRTYGQRAFYDIGP